MLPYCGEVCMLVREIEEGSEVAGAQRSKVFELVDGEVVGAWCSGVFAESDGGVHLRSGEWSVVMVEGVVLVNLAYESFCGWVVSVWQGSGELSDETRSNLAAVRQRLPFKDDRLIRIKRAAFSG